MSSNLQKDATQVISALKTTRNAAQIGSAVTSVMIIWIIAFNKAQEFLPAWGAGLLALFIVGLALGVMELGLRIFLPFALDEILGGRAWKEKGAVKAAYRVTFWIFCLALCAALALGTGGTSWIGRIDMVEAATPPPQVADLNQVRQDQDAERTRIHSSYQAQIDAAASSHIERTKEAKKAAKQLLEDAKRSKGARMYQLYVSGNGWAEKQLEPAIRKAESAGNALIQSEVNKVKELTAMQATTLSALSAGQQEVFGKISHQAETTISRFDSKFERNTFMLGVFGVGCLGLFILTNILLSLYRVLSGEPTFAEKTERRNLKINTNWLPKFDLGKFSRTPSPTAQTQIGFGNIGGQKQTVEAADHSNKRPQKNRFPESESGNFSKPPAGESGNFSKPSTGESGNFSPKTTTGSGNFSPKATTGSGSFSEVHDGKEEDGRSTFIPDNSGRTYKKRRDVKDREKLIASSFFAYQEENEGEAPTMQTLSRITGLGYKTTRKIAGELGLK